MTQRLAQVRAYVDSIFDAVAIDEERRAAYAHSYGVGGCGAILAVKRGLDPELAMAMGLLHDAYAYKTGISALHSANGAEMIRVAFKHELKGLFSEEEQTLIKSAIYHHSDKSLTHGAYEELLKDADRLQHWLGDVTSTQWHDPRLFRVFEELSLPVWDETPDPPEQTPPSHLRRSRLADIAEDLAARHIVGADRSRDYAEIIRYFPEDSAFEDFKYGWCAAFVYHCCLEAGLTLPIRVNHNESTTVHRRFGGVAAWSAWGGEHGFCYRDSYGFRPERGDIVIYEKAGQPNHIGVVLSVKEGSFVAAEGNVGNRNVSGIVHRKRDDTVRCYLRIPEDYAFEGGKEEFRTGETKTVSLP